jgi:hypothetical protein
LQSEKRLLDVDCRSGDGAGVVVGRGQEVAAYIGWRVMPSPDCSAIAGLIMWRSGPSLSFFAVVPPVELEALLVGRRDL